MEIKVRNLTLTKLVEKNETADVVGSGGLKVYSTPMLVAFMENTAYKLVEDQIEDKMATVGISIEVKHLKANLVGDELICEAKIDNIEGRRLDYIIEVKHRGELVGEAKHSRFIVDQEKFLNKLKNN